MELYIPILLLIIYLLSVLYLTFRWEIKSGKALPKDVKYRYSYLIRLKAMIFNYHSWHKHIQENDISYFIEFNTTYNKYVKSLLKSTVTYLLLTLIIISPYLYYELTTNYLYYVLTTN